MLLDMLFDDVRPNILSVRSHTSIVLADLPLTKSALYAVTMERRRISLGLWALATVTCFGPGARRPASPRRRVRSGSAARSGDAAPGGSDALYAGLRARCEQLREAAEAQELADLKHAWVVLFRGDEAGDGIHSL